MKIEKMKPKTIFVSESRFHEQFSVFWWDFSYATILSRFFREKNKIFDETLAWSPVIFSVCILALSEKIREN